MDNPVFLFLVLALLLIIVTLYFKDFIATFLAIISLGILFTQLKNDNKKSAKTKGL